jgi:hypothetical protein
MSTRRRAWDQSVPAMRGEVRPIFLGEGVLVSDRRSFFRKGNENETKSKLQTKPKKKKEKQTHLEIPDAVLPAPLHISAGPSTLVMMPRASGVSKGAAVQRHAEDDLVARDSVANVVLDGGIGGEGGLVGGVVVVVARVQVRLVAGAAVPGAGEVVGHQVDEVETAAQLVEPELLVVLFAGRGGDGEQEVWAVRQGAGVGVELGADGVQEEDHVVGLGGVGGVLPVDVDAVVSPVLEELDGGLGKGLAAVRRAGGGGEVGRVGPSANGHHDLEGAVALLEQEELLGAAVDVGARVVPAVAVKVLVDVGPVVRHFDFARVGGDIGKGVKDVG